MSEFTQAEVDRVYKIAAYNMGREAAESKRLADSNPFSEGDVRREHWHDGWLDATPAEDDKYESD